MKHYLNEYYEELDTMKSEIHGLSSQTSCNYQYFRLLFMGAIFPFPPFSFRATFPSNYQTVDQLDYKIICLQARFDNLKKKTQDLEKSGKSILLDPLSYACAKGDSKAVIKLSNKNNINYLDKLGNTPLHYATKHNHFDVVKILIFYGADINIKNKNNQKPVDLLLPQQQGEFVKYIIKLRESSIESVANLLEEVINSNLKLSCWIPKEIYYKIADYSLGDSVFLPEFDYPSIQADLLGENNI